MRAIQNLIFSGGGVKGLGYGAALTVLDSMGALSEVKGLAGTSVGALMACLLAIGYTGAELREQMLYEHTYENIIGEMTPLRLILEPSAYGLNSGEVLLQMIRDKIYAKTGWKRMTFSDLFNRFGKDVKLFVTNLNLGHATELSVHTEPGMEVALAVRASMGLPIIFDPVVYKGDYLVDGGMLINFPRDAFPPENSLGFVFVKKLSEDGISPAIPSREPIQSRVQYLTQVMVCTMRNSKALHQERGSLAVCEIEVGDTSSREFDLTSEQRLELDWLGFKSIHLWLERLKTE